MTAKGVAGLLETATEWALRLGRSFLLCCVTYAILLIGYAACQQEPFFAARLLPMTPIDDAIPFVPETVWLYGTVSYATLLAYTLLTERRDLRRLFLSLVTTGAICWVFFALVPTTYPRDLFPVPEGSSATILELADIRASDAPSNCLPSLHVALATCLALFFVERDRPKVVRVLGPIWALVVSVCTLTVKQHYLADLPAGAVVGAAAYFACRHAASSRSVAFWTTKERPLTLELEEDRETVANLRRSVEAHQWSLNDFTLPTEGPNFEPAMVRLLNHVIYIEEIAARNFRILGRASTDRDVQRLYQLFEDEEHRHAEGLRRIMLARGGWLERPGLGNALVLEQQNHLDPSSAADAILVAMSNPVFETFLDAGTIPFLRNHPALRGPGFDEFVRRVCKDEAAHIGLNWILTRQVARGSMKLRYLLNPAIYRGILAVPFMSLDVYSLAHRLGYDFGTLLPPFKKLWRLHHRYPELARFPMWSFFRLFVLCGIVATKFTIVFARWGLLFVGFWTTFSRVTDYVAWLVFGERLLRRHALPDAPLVPRS